MVRIRFDEVDPPSVYINLDARCKVYKTNYITNTVHINESKSGRICSIMIILPKMKDLSEEVIRALRSLPQEIKKD